MERCASEPILTSSVPAIGYSALPGEIRNKIMHLVLCPGHIYLRSKPTASNHYISYSNDPANATQSAPGIQLLATCRQAYNEGHALYYSGNVFHLPPGPLSATKAILDKMQPGSLTLICRVNLTAGLLDFPSLPEKLDTRASQAKIYSSIKEGLGERAYEAMDSLVKAKGLFLAAKLPGLRAMKRHQVTKLTTESFQARSTSSKQWVHFDKQQCIRGSLQSAAVWAGVMVKAIIRDFDWEDLKISLSPGRLQELEREDLEKNVVVIFEFSADPSALKSRLNKP